MRVIPELVIYDNALDREAIELAREAALRTGWQAEVFTKAQAAAESIGFFTRAVITLAVCRRLMCLICLRFRGPSCWTTACMLKNLCAKTSLI